MSKTLLLKDGQSYLIRNTMPEDASNLLNYLKRISVESDNLTFLPGELDISVEDETEFLKGVAQSINQYFIVAELNDLIIGNLTFTSSIDPKVDYFGELEISVLKNYWGNRVAFELMNNLIQWAKRNGKITKLNLQVRADNGGAIALYSKLGFEVERFMTRTFFIDQDYNVHIKYYNSYQMGKTIE